MQSTGKIIFSFVPATVDSVFRIGLMEFQSGPAGGNQGMIGGNIYYDGTDYRARSADYVSRMLLGQNNISFAMSAAAESAGAIPTLVDSFRISTTGAGVVASGYLNFGGTNGSGGYGIRDNSGVMEAKNSGGAWSVISTGKSSAPTSAVAIANTETVVTSITVAANTLRAGSVIRVKGWCSQAGTNAATPTIRIRIGTTTLTGNIAATLTGAVGTSPVTSEFEGQVTIRSVGASGTAIGGLSQFKTGVAIASNTITSTVTVDTTVSNLLEFTFISGQAANTYTFQTAQIELIHPS
jgi:hypothetical protein